MRIAVSILTMAASVGTNYSQISELIILADQVALFMTKLLD